MRAAMELFTYTLTAILATALIAAGIYLCFRTPRATAPTIGAVLSTGFLILLLLHMSKFKHVKGFGFDAETWDEKQVEAAKLVDQLSSVSEALSQQVALVASRLGLWGSGLTNPELVHLLKQLENTFDAAKIPKVRREEISLPIRQRIAYNYWEKAYTNLDATYVHQEQNANSQDVRKELDPERDVLSQLNREELIKLDNTPTEMPPGR
jgi:hypothetical protein